MKKHVHAYYEYTNKHRKPQKGKGGIVMCRNDADCVHFLQPNAMEQFREIVAAGKTPVIAVVPNTYDRATNTEQVEIYAKPKRPTRR